MDRVTSYAVSDLPHAPSYRLPQLPVFQAKTRCGCPSCHDSLSTVGHSSRRIITPPAEDSNHRHHHHHYPQTNMSSHLNTCTRTCFSQLAGHLIPHVPAGSSCSCYSHVQHAPPTPPPPPPPPAPYTRMSSAACPCCQHSSPIIPNETPHYHHISRLHLAADNITNHPPHYADAFAPPPLLHASWEPTGGNIEPHRPQALRHVYISSPSPTHSSTHQEYHMHTHHHQQIPSRRRAHCPVGSENLRNLEQEVFNSFTRHYRRYSGRSSSYPYPSGLFHPSSELFIREPLLRLEEPTTTSTPLTVPYFIEEEGVPELEYDWLEINSERVSEPKGITKEVLAKLRSYCVTKKTLEEFNDSDRCVICMCEYEVDERLRVLPCAHEFHCECIDKWLTSNPTCPICRSIVEVT